MKITLETVRQVLRDALGFESFVASFITSIEEDPNHPTAGITADGRLRYNPAFVERYVSCKADLFSLVFHELLHPMFGHFVHGTGEIENLAADAVINSAISTIYGAQSRCGSLFEKTFPERGIAGLLRPQSRMQYSRYEKVYARLYATGYGKPAPFSTGELIQTLKVLTPSREVSGVLLMGSHGSIPGNREAAGGRLPQEVLGRIAQEIKTSLAGNTLRSAGYSEIVMSMLMEAVRTHLSMRKALLRLFLTKRKVDRFKDLLHERHISVSPIPISPSKRDLVLLAGGAPPLHFRKRTTRTRKENRGLAIYLDVSGSVMEHLPKILGILRGLRQEVKSAFQFSNRVRETPFGALLQGHIQTTYGTDFNCIAESILERDFDKAVVITDGVASMRPELKDQLKRRGLRTLTILFGNASVCDDLAEFGDVVELEDVTE